MIKQYYHDGLNGIAASFDHRFRIRKNFSLNVCGYRKFALFFFYFEILDIYAYTPLHNAHDTTLTPDEYAP